MPRAPAVKKTEEVTEAVSSQSAVSRRSRTKSSSQAVATDTASKTASKRRNTKAASGSNTRTTRSRTRAVRGATTNATTVKSKKRTSTQTRKRNATKLKPTPEKVTSEVVNTDIEDTKISSTPASGQRKAPTAFAAVAATRRKRNLQIAVVAFLLLSGVGASAAVGVRDDGGQIDVEAVIKARANRMADFVAVEDSQLPVELDNVPSGVGVGNPVLPDGGLIALPSDKQPGSPLRSKAELAAGAEDNQDAEDLVVASSSPAVSGASLASTVSSSSTTGVEVSKERETEVRADTESISEVTSTAPALNTSSTTQVTEVAEGATENETVSTPDKTVLNGG